MWTFEDALRAVEYPEQGSEEDREFAAALARITGYDEQRMPAALDRYGLAGLAEPMETLVGNAGLAASGSSPPG